MIISRRFGCEERFLPGVDGTVGCMVTPLPDFHTDTGPMLGSASLLVFASSRTLVLSGEFDAGTSAGLVEALGTACATGEDLVVDMTGVTFLDGRALRFIERAAWVLGKKSATLRIAHAPRIVQRLAYAAGATDLLRS